jgi:hypothetical protein
VDGGANLSGSFPAGTADPDIDGHGLVYDWDEFIYFDSLHCKYRDGQGVKSSGTFTPIAIRGPYQWYTNGGAHTLAPPSPGSLADSTRIIVDIINNGSAGAITTSGFDSVIGKFDTVNGNKFRCFISVLQDNSLLEIVPLQGAIALNKGYVSDSYSAGTKSSGTFTPDAANGNFQEAVNGGAHTFAVPTITPGNSASMIVKYTNNASAGAITIGAFTLIEGDDLLTTVDGDDFLFYITILNGHSHLAIKALQ